jgi:hypothetical protein
MHASHSGRCVFPHVKTQIRRLWCFGAAEPRCTQACLVRHGGTRGRDASGRTVRAGPRLKLPRSPLRRSRTRHPRLAALGLRESPRWPYAGHDLTRSRPCGGFRNMIKRQRTGRQAGNRPPPGSPRPPGQARPGALLPSASRLSPRGPRALPRPGFEAPEPCRAPPPGAYMASSGGHITSMVRKW